MIDTAKLNTEELGNIIVDVQNETGFWFDVDDMVAIMQHTVRKADLNGKDEEYVPLLFRNELEDYVMRERINAIGRRNLSFPSLESRRAKAGRDSETLARLFRPTHRRRRSAMRTSSGSNTAVNATTSSSPRTHRLMCASRRTTASPKVSAKRKRSSCASGKSDR